MHKAIRLIPAALLALACGKTGQDVVNSQARARNQPPDRCTPEDFQRCQPPKVEPCPDGAEPVIDYAADCCAVFSCQPACVPSGPCNVGPAPKCPPGHTLWIGTASIDCCPAYRCTPDEEPKCDPAAPIDPRTCPDIRPGLPCHDPVKVGYDKNCCPIYECRCDNSSGTNCGCTYPTCAPGETLVCIGANPCGYPCTCEKTKPAGDCLNDKECRPGSFCDLSVCLPPAGCDPKCDPASGNCPACPALCYGHCLALPPAGDCLTDEQCKPGMRCDHSHCLPPPGCKPDQACPAVCYGLCVSDGGGGCRSNAECGAGMICEVRCKDSGCVTADGKPCDENTAPPPSCIGVCVLPSCGPQATSGGGSGGGNSSGSGTGSAGASGGGGSSTGTATDPAGTSGSANSSDGTGNASGTDPGTGNNSGNGTGASTDGSTPVNTCDPRECGPAPGMPNYPCPDGTAGGPTGRCLRYADGRCGWEIRDCDQPPPCPAPPECKPGQKAQQVGLDQRCCAVFQCVSGCDPATTRPCAAVAVVCENGKPPVQSGVDAACCPTYCCPLPDGKCQPV